MRSLLFEIFPLDHLTQKELYLSLQKSIKYLYYSGTTRVERASAFFISSISAGE